MVYKSTTKLKSKTFIRKKNMFQKLFQYYNQQSQKTKATHTHGFLVHLKTFTLQLKLKLQIFWSCKAWGGFKAILKVAHI